MNLVLIILLSILAAFFVGMIAINFMMSSNFYGSMMFVFIFISIILIYYFLGTYVYAMMASIFYIPESSRADMELWDNIWYILFIIFVMLILAVFIKSVKDNGMRWNLLLSSIGVFFILLLYTIMYYIILYNQYIGKLTFILTWVVIIYTILIMAIRGLTLSMNFTAPIFTLYGLLTIVYVICLFVWIFNMLSGCYALVHT